MLRMHADRPIDQVAIQPRPAADDGKILLLDRAMLELQGQLVMGPIVAGHEDDAAGVAVEAVDDARTRRPAAALSAGPKWNCSAPARVPDQCPRAGCTTIPGGLLTTTSSSSW